MKNKENWTQSKYIFKDGNLVASANPKEVGIGSRVIVNLVAQYYQQFIPKHVKGKTLDLGCGKVPLYGMYREYISDITCIDWENSLHDNQYLDLACDLTAPLPLENEQFDTIILSDVLEHLPNPENLWREMFRILTPGGKILLNSPFYCWIHELPFDYYRYTEFALKRFAESSGFHIIVLEAIAGIPEILADILAKFFMRYSYCKWISKTIQYLALKARKTKIIGRISKKTSKLFPLGYFIVVEKPL